MSADWEYPLGDPRHHPRNMNAYPYNVAEQRICDYLQRIAPDIGCGDDPVGFLIASHAALREQRKAYHAWLAETADERTKGYLERWLKVPEFVEALRKNAKEQHK